MVRYSQIANDVLFINAKFILENYFSIGFQSQIGFYRQYKIFKRILKFLKNGLEYFRRKIEKMGNI